MPATPRASKSAYRTPPNPYVSLVQTRAIEAGNALKAAAITHIERAKARPIEEHGITLASSFILAVTLRWLTLSKGEHLITIALITNVLLFSLITTLIQSHSPWTQYSSTVVFFAAMNALHLVHSSPLLLAALPLAIDQTKIAIVKTARKVEVKRG